MNFSEAFSVIFLFSETFLEDKNNIILIQLFGCIIFKIIKKIFNEQH